jgi:hypothetical protein
MPFDVSTVAFEPETAARPPMVHPTAHSPTAHGERPPVAGDALSAGSMFQGVAPDDTPAPAAVPSTAAVPFYSARYPRPVAAIVPRISRGVI